MLDKTGVREIASDKLLTVGEADERLVFSMVVFPEYTPLARDCLQKSLTFGKRSQVTDYFMRHSLFKLPIAVLESL